MNIRWSNIYVLQYLVVLNVNGLKLVPADRTVIKQNGSTRTISRYYLLPQTDDDTQVNLDSSASVDGDFAQFLREFNPNSKKKIVRKRRKPKPKKKTVERYRIYIKRKLRRPKSRPGAKPVPKKGKSDPDMSDENRTVTKIMKKRRPVPSTSATLPNSPTASDVNEDPEEDTPGNKKVVATPPSEQIGKPKKKDDDPESEESDVVPPPSPENAENPELPPSENTVPEPAENADPENHDDDEPVLRTNDSEFLTVEESTHGANQFAPEIEPEATIEPNEEDPSEPEENPSDDVLFTKNGEPAREGENITDPIQNIETTSTDNEVLHDPLRTEEGILEDTTTSPKLEDNEYKYDEDTTLNTDNAEPASEDTDPNVEYIKTTTSEYGKTARSPPSEGKHYQESTEYFDNLINQDDNQTEENQSTSMPSNNYDDYSLTTTKQADPIKKPYHLLYNVATTPLFSDLVNNYTYPDPNYQYTESKNGNLPIQDNIDNGVDYPRVNTSQMFGSYDPSMTESPKLNQEYVQNVESTTNPPFLGGTPPYGHFKTISIEHKGKIIDPSSLGFNKSGFEYHTYPPVYFTSYQMGDKITNNIVKPIFTNYNQINTQRPNIPNKIPPQNYNYQYSQHSATIRYPPSMNNYNSGKLQEGPNKHNDFNINGYTGKPQTMQNLAYPNFSRRPPFVGSTEYINYPSYPYYNQPSTEYSNTVRSPVDMANKINSELTKAPQPHYMSANSEFPAQTPSYTYNANNGFANTVRSPPNVGNYQDSTEYKDAYTQVPLEHNAESNGYSGIIQPPTSGHNGKGAGYPEYMNRPMNTGHSPGMMQGQSYGPNQVNNGVSQTVMKPPVSYSNSQHSTYQQYPSQIAHNQGYKYTQSMNNKPYSSYNEMNSQYTKPPIKNLPFIGYYKESSEYKETFKNHAPAAIKGGNVYMEPITDSMNYVYDNPIEDYTETIINPQFINNNHGSVVKQITFQPYGVQEQSHVFKYSEGTKFPPDNVIPLPQNIQNPENINMPVHEVHQQSHSIESSYVYPMENTIKPNIQSLGQHQPPNEHYKTLMDTPIVHRQVTQSHSNNEISRNPPYAVNNQILNSQHYADSNYQTYNPLYQIQNSQSIEYSGNPLAPVYGKASNVDNRQKPPPTLIAEPLPDFAIPNQPLFPSDTFISTPSSLIPDQPFLPAPEVVDYPKESIEYSELKNTSHNEWNIYQDNTTPENSWLPETAQTETNINNDVKENELEATDHPSHQDNSINVANLCPACFKQISSDYILGKPSSGKGPKVSLIELFKNPLAHKELLNKHAHTNPTSSAAYSPRNVQMHSIVDLLKDLGSHRHPQNVYSNPYTDRELYQIVDYLMKRDAEAADSNKLMTRPSIDLFTVENLKNVLEAFEDYKPSDIDKETANLYTIIKLILETAETQPETDDEDDGLWFNQLLSEDGNPVNNYVYNLLQQLWLQELMLQLVNNDYNLDVTRNPRWAAYLGAWRLPASLMNNMQMYNQGDYMLQNPQIQGTIYSELGHNLQGNADSLLTYLQKYLLNTQILYGRGSIQYYLKLNGILNRMAIFLRGVGYPQYVVNTLIQKLFTAMNSNINKAKPHKKSNHKTEAATCSAGR